VRCAQAPAAPPGGRRWACRKSAVRRDPERSAAQRGVASIRLLLPLPPGRHGGAERLLPDGREWGSGGLDRPTRRIPRLDL
jgi:hypothetical protein